MTVLILEEMTGDTASPCKARVNLEDGGVVRVWYARNKNDRGGLIQTIAPQDIIDTENWFVGGTDTGFHGGRLQRTLPQADPMRPAWYCRSVDDSHGFGQFDRIPSVPLSLGTGILGGALAGAGLSVQPTTPPAFAMYKNHLFGVSYGPRPYPVLADSAITQQTKEPVSGNDWVWHLAGGGGPLSFLPWTEWYRYCFFRLTAQNDYLTSQVGQYVFQTQSGQPPNRTPVIGPLKQFLPNDLIQCTWFGVPERYIWSRNSYLDRLRSTVNQYALAECPGGDGTKLFFPAGSLQYLTYEYQSYCPPVQTLVQWSPSVAAPVRLANITITWLRTIRPASDAPTPANPNFVTSGHNAQAWLSKPGQWYYQTRPQAAGAIPGPNDPPAWISAPHQLLFQDPDDPAAVQVPAVL